MLLFSTSIVLVDHIARFGESISHSKTSSGLARLQVELQVEFQVEFQVFAKGGRANENNTLDCTAFFICIIVTKTPFKLKCISHR